MLYIILYLFTEVMVSSYVSSYLGGFMSFIMIVLTAIVGISLLRIFKYSLALNIQELTSGKISQEDFVKTNMAKALGAILLIVPGFFTDILGLLLQFGFLTILFSKIFKLKTTPRNPHTYTNQNTSSANNFYYEKNIKKDDDIIDVEIIENYEKINKPENKD